MLLNRRSFTVLTAAVCLALSGVSAMAKPTITVLAAISLKESVEQIATAFKAQNDVDVEFVFGASGQLAAQIENGAPADVFLSASVEHVDRLVTAKLADEGTRRVIATNRLVLVVPANANPPAVTRFEDLASAGAKHIAVGEPKTVPAGAYAMQVLERLSLTDAVRERLIYGANVRQVADFVARGEAEAGIVYASDARAVKELRVVATADETLHKPIVYPAVVVTRTKEPKAAAAFIAAIDSEAGRAALTAHDFGTPTTQPTAQPTAK